MGLDNWVLTLLCMGVCQTRAVHQLHRFSKQFAKIAPTVWKTDHLTLYPLSPEWGHLDYQALNVTHKLLNESHGWFAGGWDDFKLEDNIREMEDHLQDWKDGRAYDLTVLSPDETECIGCVYIRPVDQTQKHLPTSAEINIWVIPRVLAADLDVHLAQTLVEWLTSKAWGFSEVQLRVRESFGRGMHLGKAAGLHLASSVFGPPDHREAFFVNSLELFSGPWGRIAADRPGCKAHSECGSSSQFCMAIDDRFKNLCSSCYECLDDDMAIDGICPLTPQCVRLYEDGRKDEPQEGDQGELYGDGGGDENAEFEGDEDYEIGGYGAQDNEEEGEEEPYDEFGGDADGDIEADEHWAWDNEEEGEEDPYDELGGDADGEIDDNDANETAIDEDDEVRHEGEAKPYDELGARRSLTIEDNDDNETAVDEYAEVRYAEL